MRRRAPLSAILAEILRGSLAAVPLLLLATLARADVRLPAVLSDHMVLQRDKPVPVWGTAAAGERVTVEFAGQTATTTAGDDGRWQVRLTPLTASAEPRTLTVRGANELVLKDVLVGEVWLGSGQSNMAMAVRSARNFEQEQAAADLPRIRMFTERSGAAKEPQTQGSGAWAVCSSETVGAFSATAFFFGRELQRRLEVPVGLINSSVGGTPIESWISPEAQRSAESLKPYFAAIDAEIAAFDSVAAAEKHELALARWEEQVRRVKEQNARSDKQQPLPRKPQDPATLLERKTNVGGLFQGKIAPLVPYAIRGVIWYQGEANAAANKAPFYRHQLPLLVEDWRAKWGEELPFAWAQLPNFGGRGDGWCLVREAQLQTLRLPRTGMAIAIDIGEKSDIHPKNKQDVGLRLAAWALGDVYQQSVPDSSGPLPARAEFSQGSGRLSFTHAGGLKPRDGELRGFEVAGEDQVFRPAKAKIDGQQVVVSSAEVARPVAARYSWRDDPDGNLVNGAGLPASPFRTDNW